MFSEELKKLAEYYKDKKNTSNLTRWKKPIYYQLLEETNFLPSNSTATQRLFHVLHDLKEIPTCKNEGCNHKVNWITTYKPSQYANYCSVLCASANDEVKNRRKHTIKEKYGVEHFSKTEEFRRRKIIITEETKQKIKQTNIEKYGYENPLKSFEIREKIKQTNIEKYGYENPFSNDDVKEKIKQTNIEKYGKEYYVETEEFEEKRSDSMLSKYGVLYSGQSDEIKEKMKNTNLERYGVKYSYAIPDLHKKIKHTNNKRYNADYFPQKHYSEMTKKRLNDKEWLIEQHYKKERTLTDIANELKIDNSTVGDYFKKYNIEVKSFFHSTGEREVAEFIKNFGVNIWVRSRKIIPPYEIDIFIPEYMIGIEYNGDYWHSFDDVKQKDALKLELCERKGIQLIIVEEKDWIANSEKVKERLKRIIYG